MSPGPNRGVQEEGEEEETQLETDRNDGGSAGGRREGVTEPACGGRGGGAEKA